LEKEAPSLVRGSPLSELEVLDAACTNASGDARRENCFNRPHVAPEKRVGGEEGLEGEGGSAAVFDVRVRTCRGRGMGRGEGA
jgi:hypothetical protein